MCPRRLWGLTVEPSQYLSFSFLGTVYFCKGMYVSRQKKKSVINLSPFFSFDRGCVYCTFITKYIYLNYVSSLRKKRCWKFQMVQ